MRAPSRARCPTCRKRVETAHDKRPKDYPFCSERCRLLDLSRWLQESFKIPATQQADDEDVE